MNEFEKFLSPYPTKKYSKGEVIIHQGDIPGRAFVIKSGYVKNADLTDGGEEKPLLFDTRWETFPIGWVFGKINRAQYYYEAFTDCEIYLVPREDYISFLRSHPDTLYVLFDRFVIRHLDYQIRIDGLSQSKAHDKILYTLRFLTSRFGTQLKGSDVKIRLPLTQQDIANILGITRETANAELKKLEKDGFIRRYHKDYIVDTALLGEALGDDFNDYED